MPTFTAIAACSSARGPPADPASNVVLTAARPALAVLVLDRLRAEITPRQNGRTRVARRSVRKVTLVIRDAEHLSANLANAVHPLEHDSPRYASVARRTCDATPG